MPSLKIVKEDLHEALPRRTNACVNLSAVFLVSQTIYSPTVSAVAPTDIRQRMMPLVARQTLAAGYGV